MALQNKAKYNLARLLARLINDPATVKSVCDDAIDVSDPANPISFNHLNVRWNNVTGIELWTQIIDLAQEQSLLSTLVQAARDMSPGNVDLDNFYDDIKDGFTRRVEKIANAIKSNNCVLFMGPELLQCLNGANGTDAFSRLFATDLSKRLFNAGIYYNPQLSSSIAYIGNRFQDITTVASRELGTEARKYFSTAKVYKNVFEKIAKLKFPLIISTNPDDILEQEYTRLNVPFVSGFYDRSNESKNEIEYDESKNIIYKIFGSFERPYSILFTENDEIQFSKNVVINDPPVPPVIRVLLENKFCLFLGFNFEEWHLKILIDCLRLAKNEDRTFALLMSGVNESSIEHFEKNYKFYFINEDIERFLDNVTDCIKNNP